DPGTGSRPRHRPPLKPLADAVRRGALGGGMPRVCPLLAARGPPPAYRPARRPDVRLRSRRGNPPTSGTLRFPRPHRGAGGRLSRGDCLSSGRTGPGSDNSTRQTADPPVRPAAGNLVPQPQRMPLDRHAGRRNPCGNSPQNRRTCRGGRCGAPITAVTGITGRSVKFFASATAHPPRVVLTPVAVDVRLRYRQPETPFACPNLGFLTPV